MAKEIPVFLTFEIGGLGGKKERFQVCECISTSFFSILNFSIKTQERER